MVDLDLLSVVNRGLLTVARNHNLLQDHLREPLTHHLSALVILCKVIRTLLIFSKRSLI